MGCHQSRPKQSFPIEQNPTNNTEEMESISSVKKHLSLVKETLNVGAKDSKTIDHDPSKLKSGKKIFYVSYV